MIVFNERWVTIHWDEPTQAVWVESKAYAEADEFRVSADVMISLIQRKRCSRYLADNRYLAPISQADQRWIQQEWFPKVVAAGIRWMAVVSAKSSVARLSVKQILSKFNDQTLTIANFDDLEAARSWLRNETRG